MFRFATAATVLLSASALLSSAPARRADSDLSLTSFTGGKVHLRELRGKPVVVNFWATWCGPCRHEMPMLADAEKLWAPKGVVFIAPSLDDKTRRDIPGFVNRFHLRFPVWTGATPRDLDRLHMGNAVPCTAFLDPEGVIFARVRGEMRRDELDARLAWVTGDRTATPPEPLVTHLGP